MTLARHRAERSGTTLPTRRVRRAPGGLNEALTFARPACRCQSCDVVDPLVNLFHVPFYLLQRVRAAPDIGPTVVGVRISCPRSSSPSHLMVNCSGGGRRPKKFDPVAGRMGPSCHQEHRESAAEARWHRCLHERACPPAADDSAGCAHISRGRLGGARCDERAVVGAGGARPRDNVAADPAPGRAAALRLVHSP